MKSIILSIQGLLLILALYCAEGYELLLIPFLCFIIIFITNTMFYEEEKKWDSKK